MENKSTFKQSHLYEVLRLAPVQRQYQLYPVELQPNRHQRESTTDPYSTPDDHFQGLCSGSGAGIDGQCCSLSQVQPFPNQEDNHLQPPDPRHGLKEGRHLGQREDMLELQDQLCKLHLEHRGLQRLQCQSYQELGSKKHELYQVLEEPECGDMEEHIQGPGEQSNPDVNYPKPLPIEESPRRRALSLPIKQSQILRVSMEEEGSLLCCCKLKKKVQFADSLGLNLASVKHFLPSDEPLVPPSVLARLQSYPPTVSSPRAELAMDEEMYSFEWASNFPATPELREKVEEQGVCLEQVSDSHWGVRGSVLVRQPSDGVQVKVRYTFNDWLSFLDCPASPPEKRASFASVAGAQRFLFTLCYPPTTSQVHFAICCNMGHGQEVWDNNQGNNYTVNCQPELIPDFQPSDTEQEEWGATQHW